MVVKLKKDNQSIKVSFDLIFSLLESDVRTNSRKHGNSQIKCLVIHAIEFLCFTFFMDLQLDIRDCDQPNISSFIPCVKDDPCTSWPTNISQNNNNRRNLI